MSGRDEVIWSKEPPSENGKYWLKWPSHEDTIGDFSGNHWWLVCLNYSITSEQLIDLGWQFGPRIPSPSELTAAAKRVEELEGAMGYLSRLFKAHAPQCEPMDYPDGLVSQIDNCMAGMRDNIASLTSQLAALKAVAGKASEALHYAKMFGSQGDVVFCDNPEHLGKSVSYFVSKSLDDLCSTLATTNGECER